MNKKCPSCGFINFVTDEHCKKCETFLPALDDPQASAYVHYSAGQGYVAQPAQTKRGFSLLKTLVCLSLGIVVLATLAGWKSGFLGFGHVSWTEYRPDNLGLTVMVPTEPTKIEPVTKPISLGFMTNHTFVSEVRGQGSATFCVVDYDTPGDGLQGDALAGGLDAELNDYVQRSKSTLISKNKITHAGMQGLEFVTQPGDRAGAAKAFGKIFASGNRLYMFSITAAEGSDLFAGKDKFLNPRLN
jgi:hypothetical protein